MAKSSKIRETTQPKFDPTLRSLVVNALWRGAATFEHKDNGGKVAGLPKGNHPIEIVARIKGDLVVNEGSAAGDWYDECAFSDSDILAALWLTIAPEQREEAITEAVRRYASSSRAAEGSEESAAFNAATEQVNALILKRARVHSLTERKRSPAKSGAVLGLPEINVAIAVAGDVRGAQMHAVGEKKNDA